MNRRDTCVCITKHKNTMFDEQTYAFSTLKQLCVETYFGKV